MDIKQFATKFMKKDKLFLILLVGVLLIIINIPTKKTESKVKKSSVDEDSSIAANDYVEKIKGELTELLSSSSMVGKCKVAISIKNEGKSFYQTEKVNFDSIPIVSEKKMPEIQGVLIIAAGAGDASICKSITEAAAAFLGISVNKIKVLKMEV